MSTQTILGRIDPAHRGRAAFAAACVAFIAIAGASSGCSRHTAPPAPVGLPHSLPSEEEAGKVREGAGEALPPAPAGPVRIPSPEEAATAPGHAATPDDLVYGFRVQLFATADKQLAEARANEYRAIFEPPVYVGFEGLLYKVQVGDCQTRTEAEALRRIAIGVGCDDAFITDELVKKR